MAILRVACYTVIALVIFSVAALIAAKALLKKSWADTIKWLLEFFS